MSLRSGCRHVTDTGTIHGFSGRGPPAGEALVPHTWAMSGAPGWGIPAAHLLSTFSFSIEGQYARQCPGTCEWPRFRLSLRTMENTKGCSWPFDRAECRVAGQARRRRDMKRVLHVGATMVLAAALTGCADRLVTLRYTPPPAIATAGPDLVILPLVDARGKEGDDGDVRRAGGIYNGYGNRYAKVMVTEPWPPRLMQALVAEFRAVGINARSGEGLSASQILTVPRLETEVRNFSTETRWTGQAHIGAVVRLRGGDGRSLIEKKIEVRDSASKAGEDLLETMLNAAFARFVTSVARDPEIQAALASLPQARGATAPPQKSTPTPPPALSERPSSAVPPRAQPLPTSSVAPPAAPSPRPSSAALATPSSDPVSGFEAQLDALADLKTRGRITEDEYQVMRRRVVEGAKPESLERAGASLSSPMPRPQLTLKWFLGSWQGRLWREGTRDAVTTLLNLKQDGSELRWEMFTARRQYLATGTATLNGERLELRGWYIGGSTSNRALSITLTKTGETLEGAVRGMENVPFLASYQRIEP